VLAPGEHLCKFCDSREVLPLSEESLASQAKLALSQRAHEEWRGELNQRLQDYRARRHRTAPNESQTALPFEDNSPLPAHRIAVDIEDGSSQQAAATQNEFAFTIAIGRVANPPETDPRLLIDVSVPAQAETPTLEASPEPLPPVQNGLFPIAPIDDRRRSFLIDAACLAFAYGGFLALFSSLGGHFMLSKLSATVCFFTFAFVYIQYFGLFTVFGGSTPGMMFSGIHVASVTGDMPTGQQYLLRAAGYLLSAGTCFLGFFWVLWDEDGLTWHDRLSKTYLARMEPFGEESVSHAAGVR
jgi:uncharacterized RDD family membrane protein YckC